MGILKYIDILLIIVTFVSFTTSEDGQQDTFDELLANEEQEKETFEISFASNLTRKKKQSDLVIKTPEKEYQFLVTYNCVCGGEPNEKNWPDVYINFVYELDEKGTSLFKNKRDSHKDRIEGTFEFYAKFPLYEKKDGKDRQQIEIHFYDHDPIGEDDYLGSAGKFNLGEVVRSKVWLTNPISGGEIATCSGVDAQQQGCLKLRPSVDIIVG